MNLKYTLDVKICDAYRYMSWVWYNYSCFHKKGTSNQGKYYRVCHLGAIAGKIILVRYQLFQFASRSGRPMLTSMLVPKCQMTSVDPSSQITQTPGSKTDPSSTAESRFIDQAVDPVTHALHMVLFGFDFVSILILIFRVTYSWFNIKILSYQYRKSHCGDKTILRPTTVLSPQWNLLYW